MVSGNPEVTRPEVRADTGTDYTRVFRPCVRGLCLPSVQGRLWETFTNVHPVRRDPPHLPAQTDVRPFRVPVHFIGPSPFCLCPPVVLPRLGPVPRFPEISVTFRTLFVPAEVSPCRHGRFPRRDRGETVHLERGFVSSIKVVVEGARGRLVVLWRTGFLLFFSLSV